MEPISKLDLEIIEGNLFELKDINFYHSSDETEIFKYLKILIYYFEGDAAAIDRIRNNQNISKYLALIATIRSSIVRQNVDIKSINELESLVRTLNKPLWEAESYFILGWAFREICTYHNASFYFKKAYIALWDIHARKKAVKALLNYVVCQTHLDPSKRYLSDFQFVHKKAIAVDDPIVQGICELNIGREYRILKSYDLAEDLITKSITNLEADRGGNNYYFAVLEYCLLLTELNRFKQAHKVFQIINETEIVEIKEAAKVILSRLGGREYIDEDSLDPVWKDVLNNKQDTQIKLTQTEAHLLNFLSSGEKLKSEILSSLYGEKINLESADNRFKVLLSRLRKKAPKLISYSHGHYFLAEAELTLKKMKFN